MIKSCLIIPIYKQYHNCRKIFDAISVQSVLPDHTYLVLDRATRDEVAYVESLVTQYKMVFTIIDVNALSVPLSRNDTNERFLAGHMRNVGVEAGLKDSCDIFIFIDGDCVPQKDLIKSHIEACNRTIPVLSIGRRREQKYGWKDQREVDNNLMHLGLFGREDVIVNNPDLLKKCLIVWSCNLSMNRLAIDRLYRFNNKYYTKSEVFNSIFLGEWGGEDSFLGISAWHCRIFIVTMGALSSGIEHIDHPRPSDKYTIKHKDYFEVQCDNIRKKVAASPLLLDFFSN